MLIIARATARRHPAESRRTRPTWPAQLLAMRGRVREALRTRPITESDFVFAGELGILPEDSMRAGMAGLEGPPWIYSRWLAMHRDTATLASLSRLADSLADVQVRSRAAMLNRQVTRTFLALARGDSTAAFATMLALPDTILSGYVPRLTKAQLLVAHGRDREAAALLDQALCCARNSPLEVVLELDRARLAERLGDVPRAIEGYRYVVDMWRYADPELQPFVAEARQALGRLTAEPRQ